MSSATKEIKSAVKNFEKRNDALVSEFKNYGINSACYAHFLAKEVGFAFEKLILEVSGHEAAMGDAFTAVLAAIKVDYTLFTAAIEKCGCETRP